jgi:PASTA domain
LRFRIYLMCLFVLFLPFSLGAQDNTAPTIPDVTGLPVPQAAATLNRAGFRLGTQTFTESSGSAINTVSEQSPIPGESAEAGTQVDLTVQRAFNTRLVWDENDFTVVFNGNSGSADALWLNRLNFMTRSGPDAQFIGRWSELSILSGFCAQIWTEPVRGAKDVPGCAAARTTLWLTTNNPAEHFWTNGAAQFEVTQDGVYRGMCEVAALECRLYLPPGLVAPDVTEYFYFVYTPEQFLMINQSADRWMPTYQLSINGYALGSSANYDLSNIIGDVHLLAPEQCLQFASTVLDETALSEPCDLIASTAVDTRFWASGFERVSTIDGETRICPPPVSGQPTICLLPR